MRKGLLRFLMIFTVMLIAAAFLFTGCKKKEEEAVAEEPVVVVEEWEIPFLNVLTGPIASIGEYLQWGAERAAEEINAAGGIAGKPVKVLRVDTGMEPEKGIVEMSKLVDTALCVLGPVPEPVIMAAVPVAVEAEMYSFTATTSYEYAVEYFPWAVSWFPPTEARLGDIVEAWANLNPEMKTVVQFVENYGPWPGMAAAHTKGLKAAGVEVLPDVDVPGDAVTFGPQIVKALASEPDGIVFVCNAEKVAKIIIELKNRGWENMNHVLVFSSADDAALYTTGGSAIDGVMIYNYADPNLDTPRWNAFRQAFKDDHDGIEPFSLSPNYYDAVYMIKEAIEATGVTGDPDKLAEERVKIRDYCNNIQDFEGLQFNWSNENGVPTNKPLFLFKIEGGKKTLFKKIIPTG